MFLLVYNRLKIRNIMFLLFLLGPVSQSPWCWTVSIAGERVAISTKSYTLILGVSYYILLYYMEQRLKDSSARQLEQHCIHTRDMPQHSTITQSKYIHKLSIWSSIDCKHFPSPPPKHPPARSGGFKIFAGHSSISHICEEWCWSPDVNL